MNVSQEAKERMQYREKNKKKLAFTIIGGAILLGGVVCAVALPLMYCKPPSDEKVIEINATNVTNYLIDASTSIYVDQSLTVAFGHKLLDLKALSDDNDNITHFVITENIDFGFLVNPDMDCHLSAKNNAIVNCVASSDEAVGVIIGSVEPCSGIYTKNLIIDQTTTFTISSTSGFAYGVFFNSTAANSTQIINGTFTISSTSSTHGVALNSAAGNTTISGTFTISSTSYDAYGVAFSITAAGSTQTISGTFAISSASSTAYGVVFSITAAGSTQTISGTFTISSASSTAIGVYLSAAISGNITISGTFTISSTSSCSGVYFYGYEGASINGNTTISGTFAISSASSTAYGVFFRTTASCTLTMVGSQFFSNQVDSGNIFTIYPSDDADHNYKWNGAEMTSDSHSSSADETLALVSVSDQLPNPNFTIKAINTAGVDGSKATFNTTYKNALSVYATSVDCPATAKPWLMSIIGQIPTT